MDHCQYIYCRAALSDATKPCPRCGHPPSKEEMLNPFFLAASPVEGLPTGFLDMHQIVPDYPRMAEAQVFAMDQYGVESALLQSAPDQATSLCGNDQLLELANGTPGRFWPSHFIDPRTDSALEEVERAKERGVRVIKLLPPIGFRLDDPACDALLEAMEAHRLVAMVHTGFITARHKAEEKAAGAFMSSTFADPLTIDLPARKFPDLTFILCHLGGAIWCEQAGQMVTQHDNVWGDTSGFGVFALQRLLRRGAAIDWSKVFWGNDSVAFAYPLNLRLHLAALREAGAERLLPALLRDNGRRFADAFLS